jgi:hypothetical protein
MAMCALGSLTWSLTTTSRLCTSILRSAAKLRLALLAVQSMMDATQIPHPSLHPPEQHSPRRVKKDCGILTAISVPMGMMPFRMRVGISCTQLCWNAARTNNPAWIVHTLMFASHQRRRRLQASAWRCSLTHPLLEVHRLSRRRQLVLLHC